MTRDIHKRHPPFQKLFIIYAHVATLFIGLPLAIYVGYMFFTGKGFALDFSLIIQLHGHIQLFAWTGWYIIGVSLYFLSRLTASPLPHGLAYKYLPWMLFLGVCGEVISRILLEYAKSPHLLIPLLRLSLLMELAGLILYIVLLGRSFFFRRKQTTSGFRKVQPFILTMIIGFLVYMLYHTVTYFSIHAPMQNPALHGRFLISVHIFWTMVLIPVALAFSYQTFPLFLLTPVVSEQIRIWGFFYFFMSIIDTVLVFLEWSGWRQSDLHTPFHALLSLLTLVLIWKSSIFQRCITRFITKKVTPQEKNWLEHSRAFGAFEWLLYPSYFYFTLALVGTIGLLFFKQGIWGAFFNRDILHHLQFLGFIHMLILGMAQRMLPGFFHKKRVAFPSLVGWIAFMAHCGVLLRIFSIGIANIYPPLRQPALIGFGMSAWFIFISVIMLSFQLWKTTQLPSSYRTSPG